MNLTGKWKGKYTYGMGYSHPIRGLSEPFEFTIADNNGSFTGSCIDNVVKEIDGNESYIMGTFFNKVIKFKKRYKIHAGIDDNGMLISDHTTTADGVDYSGILKKKFFSRKYYFEGEWSITMQLQTGPGELQIYNCKGKWRMKKMD